MHITFTDDILPFLKYAVLPNCRLKDQYLRSTIEQYVDYLEGMFNKREIQKDMNEKLKKTHRRKIRIKRHISRRHAKD